MSPNSNRESPDLAEAVTSREQSADGTEKNTPTSFLSLSAELRNTIYHLSLVKKTEIFITSWQDYLTKDHARRLVFGKTSDFAEPPLLRSSKQIRAETLPIFYGANVFEFDRVPTIELLVSPKPQSTRALFRELRITKLEDCSVVQVAKEATDAESRLRQLGLEQAVVFVELQFPQATWDQVHFMSKERVVHVERFVGPGRSSVLNEHTAAVMRVKSDEPLELEEMAKECRLAEH